jgi:hypothetical protein
MIAAFVSMLCVWEVKRRRDSNRLYLIAGAKHD